MTIGEKLKSIADDVNDKKAKNLAEEYCNSIIKELEEVAQNGSYEYTLESKSYNELYCSGAPLLIKHLKELLEPEKIHLEYNNDDNRFYVKF